MSLGAEGTEFGREVDLIAGVGTAEKKASRSALPLT